MAVRDSPLSSGYLEEVGDAKGRVEETEQLGLCRRFATRQGDSVMS